MKRTQLTAMILSLVFLLTACAGTPSASAEPADAAVQKSEDIPAGKVSLLASENMFTDRDSRTDYESGVTVSFGDTINCSDPSLVSIDGQTLTIKSEGTYVLSGKLNNGSVVIDAPKDAKIQLVLSGVEIYSADFAAIYVKQADKVFITLEGGAENILSNGGSFESLDENNVDAVIFSKDDLSFNGEGSLRIKSPAGNGICTKDDLVFTGGTYVVTAAGHALEANDSVRICAGSFHLDSGKDGVHCENDGTEPGFVYVSNGSFDILSDGDAISADGCVQLDGGTFELNCGGGSGTVTLSGEDFKWSRAQEAGSDDQASAKGVKSGMSIAVNAGELLVDSADDSLHASENLYVSGGTLTLSSGDDALHADEKLCISGGSLDILKSYEGIEGREVYISGGDINVASLDDGINAAGGRDQSGSGGYRGFGGNGAFTGDFDSLISISGGSIHVNAEGDGLDSNGTITVTDGDVFIEGPTNSGNSALDYELSAEISGGTFAALGSMGMAQNFSTASQGAMLISPGEQEAGSTVTVSDSKGNVIFRYVPEKRYSSVVLSLGDIRQGETYTVTAGTYSAEITMDSLVYSEGGASGMGIRPNGGKHGAPGERPMPPDGESPARPGDIPMKK